jgi:drug/metabolite transporter (DMT)-like permease
MSQDEPGRTRPSGLVLVLIFVLLAFIWGSTWLAIKIGLGSLPPFTGAGVRFLIAGLLLLGILRVRRIPIPADRARQPTWMLIGLLMFGLSYAAVYWGEQYISSGLASVLFATMPLFLVILSPWLLPEERLSVVRVVGVVVGFLGIVFLFSSDLSMTHPRARLGGAVLLLSPLCAAVANVLMKRKSRGMNPLAFLVFPMLYGALALLAVGLPLEGRRLALPDAVGTGALLYLAIMGSIVAFSCYVWLLRHLEVSRTSLLAYMTPVTALLLGRLVLGERLGLRTVGGSALVLLGTFLATRPRAGTKRGASSADPPERRAPSAEPGVQDVQNSATTS